MEKEGAGPRLEDIDESKDSQASRKEESKPKPTEKIADELLEYGAQKRKKKRFWAMFGLFTFFLGTGLNKEKIFAFGSKIFRSMPISKQIDKWDSARFKLPGQAEEKVKVEVTEENQDKDAESSVYLGDLEVDLQNEPDFGYEKLFDKDQKIDINNLYLKNLIAPKFKALKEPKDKEKYAKIISDRLHSYLDAEDYKATSHDPKRIKEVREERRKFYESGSVKSFVEICNYIVEGTFKYDERTESWHDYSQERLQFKIGKTNPITAIISGGGQPIEKFLEKSTGYCVHYAEAMCYVAEEVKRQNSGKFQNIYVVPFFNAYKFHYWNAWILVKSDKKIVLGVRNYNADEVPGYDFLRTIYFRNIISEEKFFEISSQYFIKGGRELEEPEDFQDFMELALDQRSPAALKSIKDILLNEINENYKNQFSKDIENAKKSGSYVSAKNERKYIKIQRDKTIEELKNYFDRYKKLTKKDLLEDNPFMFPQLPEVAGREDLNRIIDHYEKVISNEKTPFLDDKICDYFESLLNILEDSDSEEINALATKKIEENFSRLFKYNQEKLNKFDIYDVRSDQFTNYIEDLVNNAEILLEETTQPEMKEKIRKFLDQSFLHWEEVGEKLVQSPSSSFMSKEELNKIRQKINETRDEIKKKLLTLK